MPEQRLAQVLAVRFVTAKQYRGRDLERKVPVASQAAESAVQPAAADTNTGCSAAGYSAAGRIEPEVEVHAISTAVAVAAAAVAPMADATKMSLPNEVGESEAPAC